MNKKQKENNYVFIDAQNLHLGTKDEGWSTNLFKFRIYLKDKYNASKIFWFAGI